MRTPPVSLLFAGNGWRANRKQINASSVALDCVELAVKEVRVAVVPGTQLTAGGPSPSLNLLDVQVGVKLNPNAKSRLGGCCGAAG